jgi:hypothetical protein
MVAPESPLVPLLRYSTGLDNGWTAFRIRSESETQPSAISALRSEVEANDLWLLLKEGGEHVVTSTKLG